MKYPAAFLSLGIGLLLSSPFSSVAVAATVAYDALKQTVEGDACGGVGARKGYVKAMKRTWDQVRGDQSTSTAAGSRSCDARVKDAEDCCTAGDANFKAKCEARFRDASSGAIQPTEAITHDNPFDTTEDKQGMRADMEAQKKALYESSREKDRMAGMCRALQQACENSCDANAVLKPKCGVAQRTSQEICVSANRDLLNSGVVNPGLAGPGKGGAAGGGQNGGGGGQNGGGQAGGGTQKPQSAQQGGGNPLDALKQAMQAMQQQQQPQQQPQQQEDPTQQTCDNNPALAGCPTKKEEDDSWNKKQAAAEFEDKSGSGEGGTGNDFNVPDSTVKSASYNGNGEQKFGTPATNGTVANGGGQMPGGQGGGASPGGGGSSGGYAAASKAATDIMHGMMSGGGYSQMNAAMQMQNGGNGGGFSGYNGNADPLKNGPDLRQFLPGHKSDPTRKLAGGAASFQIQPQTVNIWSRISERFKARCSQGLLRDCN